MTTRMRMEAKQCMWQKYDHVSILHICINWWWRWSWSWKRRGWERSNVGGSRRQASGFDALGADSCNLPGRAILFFVVVIIIILIRIIIISVICQAGPNYVHTLLHVIITIFTWTMKVFCTFFCIGVVFLFKGSLCIDSYSICLSWNKGRHCPKAAQDTKASLQAGGSRAQKTPSPSLCFCIFLL